MYLGLVKLSEVLAGSVLVKNSSGTPINSDALPTYRVYGPSGLMTNGTGSLAFKDTGSVTGATNATPIVITSSGHGLTNGTRVTITGVGGNTAANTTALVANKTSTTFEMAGVAGNGSYTSGGTWNVSGLYNFTFTPTGANGFESGENYYVLVQGALSSTLWTTLLSFTVV